MAKATNGDTVEPTHKMSNNDRRANRLRAEIRKGHNWRVQVWAQQETRINAKQAELEAMGYEGENLYEPDFTVEANLEHYSKMNLEG